MSALRVGQRVTVVGGKHFGRSGVVTEFLEAYPQRYRVRLDGKTGLSVLVAPNNLGALTP